MSSNSRDEQHRMHGPKFTPRQPRPPPRIVWLFHGIQSHMASNRKAGAKCPHLSRHTETHHLTLPHTHLRTSRPPIWRCPDCSVQTGYSQHSPGQTLFLNAKGYTLKNVNNIVCAQNYIRKSDYKVCHGTVWVKINYVFFNQLPEAELLFVIEEKRHDKRKCK